jgi:hypothetical protein
MNQIGDLNDCNKNNGMLAVTALMLNLAATTAPAVAATAALEPV